MPCYCAEGPVDNTDALKRIKARMHFAGCNLLDEKQEKLAIENNIRLCSRELDIDLCKLCKILTVEQMKSISGDLSGFSEFSHQQLLINNLLEWYEDHLSNDYRNNTDRKERANALKELIRINDVITT